MMPEKILQQPENVAFITVYVIILMYREMSYQVMGSPLEQGRLRNSGPDLHLTVKLP
jgi:hypothetical protein